MFNTYLLNEIILTQVLKMDMGENIHCSMICSSKEPFIVFIAKGTEKQNVMIMFKGILCYSKK